MIAALINSSQARVVVLIVLFATGLMVSEDASASDRDTPAYRIYVDPVTGRYSTKPPEDRSVSTAPDSIQSTPAIATAGNRPDIRRPLIAVTLLVGIATASLLAGKRQL